MVCVVCFFFFFSFFSSVLTGMGVGGGGVKFDKYVDWLAGLESRFVSGLCFAFAGWLILLSIGLISVCSGWI